MNFLSFSYTIYSTFYRLLIENKIFFIIILRNLYGSLLDTINMIFFSLCSSALRTSIGDSSMIRKHRRFGCRSLPKVVKDRSRTACQVLSNVYLAKSVHVRFSFKRSSSPVRIIPIATAGHEKNMLLDVH